MSILATAKTLINCACIAVPEVRPEEKSFDEGEHPRDEQGQFTYKDAVGKTGDWKSLGLPHAKNLRADSASAENDPNEARERLKAGFTVKDHAGRDLKFGGGIIEHWQAEGRSEEEQNRRLRHLDDAIEAGRNSREQWDHGWQRNYIRVSQDAKSKRRYHMGFVSDQDGVVRSFFHTDRATRANVMRKGTLKHGRD